MDLSIIKNVVIEVPLIQVGMLAALCTLFALWGKFKFILICLVVTVVLVFTSHLIIKTIYAQDGTKISRSEVAEYQYVASLNSEVFHKPTCRWVKKIYESNLIGFKTRDEAVKSGRRPCKVCKP